jgi:cell division ATPase FtsA
MGAGATKMYIVEQGIIKASHVVNRGSQDITQALAQALSVPLSKAEEIKRTDGLHYEVEGKPISAHIPLHVDYLLSEATKVLLHYQEENHAVVSKVVLTGGGVLLRGFLEKAQEHFDTEVIMGNPFEKIETPAFLEDMFRKAGPEFAVAVGIALRELQEA